MLKRVALLCALLACLSFAARAQCVGSQGATVAPTGGSACSSIAGASVTPPGGFPSTIAGSGSWQSGVLAMAGYRGIAAAVTSTQAGSISIQRYADSAGQIAIGAAISQALAASTAATVSVNDGLPALYFQVTISNSSGSTATISGAAIVMTGM